MKIASYVLAIGIVLVGLLAVGSRFGLVGFHYPYVILNEPLRSPQKVLRVEGGNIILENGQVIALDERYASDINSKLIQSGFEIDIHGSKGEPVAIFARQNGWVCGTPWAQMIRIPLIRDTTYKNRRQLVAVGTYVESGGQQDGAANRGQPIRSETNRTSAAAGSGR